MICAPVEDDPMNRGTAGFSMYASLTPVRWLKAAVAFADLEVAKLCANQWRNTALVPVAVQVRRSRVR